MVGSFTNDIEIRESLGSNPTYEEALGARWVRVEVTQGKTAFAAILDIRVGSNVDVKVREYGNNGYLEKSRYMVAPFGWMDWKTTYYIEHEGYLYEITFRNDDVLKKVFVAIGGYGKVNH